MENQQQSENVFGLTIQEEARQVLKTLSIWARIVAITAFVSYGLAFVVAIIGRQYSDSPYPYTGSARAGGIIGALIMLAIGIPLNLYLYNFAKSSLASIASSDTNQLENGFYNLRKYFKFLGILFVIILVCFGLIVLFAILGALVGGLRK